MSQRPHDPKPAFLEIQLPSFDDVANARRLVSNIHGTRVVARANARSNDEEGWALIVYPMGTSTAHPTLGFKAVTAQEANDYVGRYLGGDFDARIDEAGA